MRTPMRPWIILLAVGCNGPADTGPIGGVDPNPDVFPRIVTTWEVFDQVGPATCPDDYIVEVFAPPDATDRFPCPDLAGTLAPAPVGAYEMEIRFLDADETVLDTDRFFVTIVEDGEDFAFGSFILP